MRFLADLVGDPRARFAAKRFVVEGPKLVELALSSGRQVDSVFFDSEESRRRFDDLGRRAAALGARVAIIAPGAMRRVSATVSPQGVLAVTEMVEASLGDLPALGLVLVCVDVADPGNLGTSIRAAVAAGAEGVVVCDGCADAYNPKAVRASAGALLHCRLITKVAAGLALATLADLGYRRLGAVARGGVDYDEVDLAGPVAVVAGGESRGIPADLLNSLDGGVTIPMAVGSESLNVAMAAAVLCFEVARRGRSSREVGRESERPAGNVEPDRSKATGPRHPRLEQGSRDLDRRLRH